MGLRFRRGRDPGSPMKKIRCVLIGRIARFMVQCNIKLITGYYKSLPDHLQYFYPLLHFIFFSIHRIAPLTDMAKRPCTFSHLRMAGQGNAFRQTGENQWKTMDWGEFIDRLR
jgi:hypothetical protein